MSFITMPRAPAALSRTSVGPKRERGMQISHAFQSGSVSGETVGATDAGRLRADRSTEAGMSNATVMNA